MRLQLDRRRIELLIERLADVTRLALQLKMILHQHAVEEDGHKCRRFQRAIIVEEWSGPDHIVTLPLTRLAHRIRQRNALLVNTSRHTIHVCRIVVRVEHLQFVTGVARARGREKNSAVAARLARSGDVFGDSPLDVKLIILESPLGLNISRRFIHGHNSVGDDPPRR